MFQIAYKTIWLRLKSACHYRTGTEQLAPSICETESESLVNASSVLKIKSPGIFFLHVACHVLDFSLVYPSVCLGYIGEQTDPVPLCAKWVSLTGKWKAQFKLDKYLNASKDCLGSSAGKKENIFVGSQYFKIGVQLLNLFQKSKHCKMI